MQLIELHTRTFPLICRSCRYGHKQLSRPARSSTTRGRFSTSAAQLQRKPYYVTSPIFYVNAEPHAGHLYTLLLTDVLKRWHRLKGDERATLLTGTDEHGMKIQKAAARAKLPVKDFCDMHAAHFLNLADRANIKYDRFIRTTDQDHIEAVKHFWKALQQRGFIYQAKHEGWYSVSDETFYPESQVHLILDPETGRKIHVSIETGKEVEWTSEVNYHFRLSAFKDRLLALFKSNPNYIVPQSRQVALTKEVEDGLSDLSISRPTSRLQWGIRVPDDDSQTIYVWVDALINYLAYTGYPNRMPGANDSLWPADCHVIGKDIVRFHCIYWPALLMALDLPVPKQFLTHAHWTMANAKMSKSLGNGVNPFLAMNVYGRDTIRYFMLHDGGIENDADYENSYIVEKYKKGLQGGLGNLSSRITRTQVWSVPEAVQQAAKGFKVQLPHDLEDEAASFAALIDKTSEQADGYMMQPHPRKALHTIMELVYATNKFFHQAEPWHKAKIAQTSDDRQSVNKIVYLGSEAVRVACILLQPFMPEKTATALDWLGVDVARRSFQYARYAADLSYGRPLQDPGRAGERGTLFPRLLTEF